MKIKYGPLVTLSFLFFITTIIVRPATADDLIEVLSPPDMASVGGNRIGIHLQKRPFSKRKRVFFVELFCCDLRDGNHRVTLGLIASNRYEAVTNLVDLGHESVGVNAKRLYRIETDLQFDPLF